MIPFNKPAFIGTESKYLEQVLKIGKFAGNNFYSKKCVDWFKGTFGAAGSFLTPSCTHSLEMSAILADIQVGDEVIMASYNFTSTANAFVLRGARINFVDIRPDTMNIDEKQIEMAISPSTKAIVAMHYAGVSCHMDTINEIAQKNGLIVIEDAAQAIMSKYNGHFCGTLAQFGCFSFHETKNVHCGEGGALLTNDRNLAHRAEIIQEKGTNRASFFRGEINKYGWIDIGSSFLTNELSASFLLAQLEGIDKIQKDRLTHWNYYSQLLTELYEKELVELPVIPNNCEHNAHIFYIKVKDINERKNLIEYLNKSGVKSVFHYIPLHSSIAGKRFGCFRGEDVWTTNESERIIRLPLYYKMSNESVEKTVKCLYDFYSKV